MNGRCLPDRMQLFADAITDTENSKTYKKNYDYLTDLHGNMG
jgi:hypothetical protein